MMGIQGIAKLQGTGLGAAKGCGASLSSLTNTLQHGLSGIIGSGGCGVMTSALGSQSRQSQNSAQSLLTQLLQGAAAPGATAGLGAGQALAQNLIK